MLSGERMIIEPLNQKLLRDIASIKAQIAAIVLVMAAGIAVFVIMFGVLDSLKLTKETYYDRYQFADIFASLKRAPESLKKRIDDIPGVSVSQTRVSFGMTLNTSGMIEPASGKILSVPDAYASPLNQLYLHSGRMLHPNEGSAVLADQGFFEAHNLSLGDKLSVTLNGQLRELKVVGVVLSPEYVYSIAPGALMPDSKRYGIFWMSRSSLSALTNMKGAFNDLAIKTERKAKLKDIALTVDQILAPYGGLLAYDRSTQLSNFFVENELKQLYSMGMMAPMIFLSVAAFLVNVVMSRQIATQREQIGMLKAVGYSNLEVASHYLKLVLLIVVMGALLGLFLGTWMGAGMTRMYTEFFHFPILKYSFSTPVMIFAVMSCTLAAVIGTLFAIRHATSITPAEAMRPESPAVFKTTLLERLGVNQHLSFLSRIVLRQLERRPIRALFSTLGMSLALCILIFSFFMEDSMNYLMDIQYDLSQREDLNISFVDAKPLRALEEIRVIPGVLKVEPIRTVAVKLKFKHYEKRTAIIGLIHNPDLFRVINEQLKPLNLPARGLVISQKLAEILHLSLGDKVEVDVLEEKRPSLTIPVTAITQEFIGLGAYMNIHELSALLDETPKITGASIMVDPNHSALLYQELKDIPAIIGLNIMSVLRKIFEDLMAENLLKMVSINILFASFISFGVVYNTARIALSERGRELANLRVLGLTQGEVAYLLFGELAVITSVSIPVGILFAQQLALMMTHAMSTELFRIPLYIANNTYGVAVAILLLSTLLSFYLVWRRVNKIDLVSAQKGAV